MKEKRLTELLREARPPDEREAAERGWQVIRRAFHRADVSSARPRRGGRVALAVAVGLLLLALGLSPAGARVADLVGDVVHRGDRTAQPALTSLPTTGRLLVTSPTGPWVVARDGAKRRLGEYDDATWSPHGLFVAATAGRELTAVEPDGTVRWSLAANHPVTDAAWSPSGVRIAYRAGDSVRVVAGDGTGDRLFARRAAPPPPAWSPDVDRNVLAFAGTDARIHAVDVDTGRTLWRSARLGGSVRTLQWAPSGRLLVLAGSSIVLLDRRGRALVKEATGGLVEGVALAPSGKELAIARRTGAGSELVLLRPRSHGPLAQRRLFAGPGRFTDLIWSPDGAWLLLGWRRADQWLFIRPANRKVVAVSGISQQFAPGASGPIGFPRVAGWCCKAPLVNSP
jgi:hypothetical protein